MRRAWQCATTAAWICVPTALSLLPAGAWGYTHSETPAGQEVRWTEDEVRFVVDDSVAEIAPVHAVEAALREACETWIAAADLPLDFTVELGDCGKPGYHGDDDENCVMACDSCVEHDQDVGARALVSAVLETGRIVDADIVLFTDAGEWSIGNKPGALPLRRVLLHEIGHVLGLGHSEIPEARMYSTISTGEQEDDSIPLHEDDIQGATSLYPEQAPGIDTAGCGWRCAAATGAPGGLAGCLLFVSAAFIICIRRR